MKKATTVTLDDSLLEKLRKASKKDGRTVSNLVELWVRSELTK